MAMLLDNNSTFSKIRNNNILHQQKVIKTDQSKVSFKCSIMSALC